MPKLKEASLRPDQILLDPNNYRFHDDPEFTLAEENRFLDETVQRRAAERLRGEEILIPLKNSILQSGFVPVERLVVRPYEHAKDTWVVIEGNRRLACIRWIHEDFEAGAPVDDHAIKSLEEIPVVILEDEDPIFRASLMGIRHVSGIKEWGGYQRSKLIVELRDDMGLEPQQIANQLGMRTQEVNRRFRAFKALEQMEESEDYGGFADSAKYPLFHEALAIPVVRDDWLGWNEEKNEFEKLDNLNNFYELVTPQVDDEGNERQPKITTFAHVRNLRDIVAKRDALRLLLDPGRSLQEAIAVAKQDEMARAWKTDVAIAIESLENLSVQQLKELDAEDVELLKQLTSKAAERLEDFKALSD